MFFHRTTSKLALKTWPEKFFAFVELTPSLEGAAKGQPKPGEHRYDYDRSIRIKFTPSDLYQCAYHLLGLTQGVRDLKYTKYADLSKSEHSDSNDKKQLTISSNEKGGVSFFMSQNDKKINITISEAEAYAVSKWMEAIANNYSTEIEYGKKTVEE